VIRDLQRNRLPEGIARAGVEQRLAVLDNRIVELEQAIADNGRMLANAPLSVVAKAETPAPDGLGPFTSGQATAITIVALSTVALPLAGAMAWRMIVRAHRATASPQAIESVERLARLEQAIDAMAVEVERISEGQRFVTHLLASGERDTVAVRDTAPR
jgi:hypothetical protein